MTTHRFANTVVIDRQANEILIDGLVFPYWIQPDPEIELPPADHPQPAVLHIGIYVDNLTYITEKGEEKVLAVATPSAESEWTKRRAKEIVLEGMADVVEWLARAEHARQRETRAVSVSDLLRAAREG